MATVKKSTTSPRTAKASTAKASSTKPRAGSQTKDHTLSSTVMSLVSGVMGDSLSEAVTNLKSKVSEQVAVHGEEYLDSAREHIGEAVTQLVTWGKKHPVKTVAAAAALIAVSGFLYATLNGQVGQMLKKAKAK